MYSTATDQKPEQPIAEPVPAPAPPVDVTPQGVTFIAVTDNSVTPQDRGGAPIGNANALKHGLRCGRLPAGCGHIGNAISMFRRTLETESLSVHGELSILHRALINSACRHEQRAQLLQRWLRKEAGTLKTMDKATLLAQQSAATDQRDKCLERLGLDRDESEHVLATFYTKPAQGAQQ